VNPPEAVRGDRASPLLSVHARCKPWRWVGHLLGHEARGSLAYALKQEGLIQVRACGAESFFNNGLLTAKLGA